MDNEVLIKHIGSSVQSWLNFISSVGREFTLSESSIKMPLAEFIGTKIADADAVKLEFLHPNLFMKRMDLFYKKKGIEGEIQSAFEFKYVKDASTIDNVEKQRVFNDLMRLHIFINNASSVTKGYFLICGSQYEFDQSFQRILTPKANGDLGPRKYAPAILPKEAGFYTEWFKFDYSDPIKTIMLNQTDSEHSVFYKTFFENYEPSFERQMEKKMTRPNEIKTKLIFISQDNVQKDVPEPMKLGIWEVLN
jgi:hypothetical protein